MKKILTILFVLAIAQPCVFATYEVNYNNAGAVIDNNRDYVFGQNALFTPENAQRAGAMNRQIKYENAYYENLGKPRTIIIQNTTAGTNSSPAKTTAVQTTQQQASLTNDTAQENEVKSNNTKPKKIKTKTQTTNGVTFFNVPVEK